MWLFGQVWFACLVGFGAGVLLDWALRVRPLRRRIEELEDQLAEAGRAAAPDQPRAASFDSPSAPARSSSYDDYAAPAAATSLLGSRTTDADPADDYAAEQPGADRQRGFSGADRQSGFAGSDQRTSFAGTDERTGFAGADQRTSFAGTGQRASFADADERTGFAGSDQRTGFEGSDQRTGFVGSDRQSGFAAPPPPAASNYQATAFQRPVDGETEVHEPSLADILDADEDQHTPTGYANQSTGYANQPTSYTDQRWQSEQSLEDESGEADGPEPAYPKISFDGGNDADQQYLEYLRNAAPEQSTARPDQHYPPAEPQQYADDQYAEPSRYPAPEPDGSNEVTMVGGLAPTPAEDEDAHGILSPQAGYPEDEYEHAHTAMDDTDADDVNEVDDDEDHRPAEVTTVLPIIDVPDDLSGLTADATGFPGPDGPDLPHRAERASYADHIPFTDMSEAPQQSGQLTPIGNGGFQPFEKPLDPDEFARHDVWVGEDGQLMGRLAEEPPHSPPTGFPESPTPVNGTPLPTNGQARQPDRAEDAWFHERNGGADRPFVPPVPTGNHRPVPERPLPERIPEQAADTNRPRSLFEPVIDPEQSVEPSQDDHHAPPRPIRVRTGVEGRPPVPPVPPPPAPAPPQQPQPSVPARAPAGSNGWQIGPFGPGSALPMPDGSAPSPQFSIKARTSSMVFHTESSPFYERLEPQVWFRSAEDAQRAGFTSWERPRQY